MRVPIAYYLVLLYATVMFKPLIPIVNDTLSHIFSEAIHIATVHAIYGSNHLEKELSKEEKDSNKNQSTINSAETSFAHIIAGEVEYKFIQCMPLNNYPASKPSTLNIITLSQAGPPPKNS